MGKILLTKFFCHSASILASWYFDASWCIFTTLLLYCDIRYFIPTTWALKELLVCLCTLQQFLVFYLFLQALRGFELVSQAIPSHRFLLQYTITVNARPISLLRPKHTFWLINDRNLERFTFLSPDMICLKKWSNREVSKALAYGWTPKVQIRYIISAPRFFFSWACQNFKLNVTSPMWWTDNNFDSVQIPLEYYYPQRNLQPFANISRIKLCNWVMQGKQRQSAAGRSDFRPRVIDSCRSRAITQLLAEYQQAVPPPGHRPGQCRSRKIPEESISSTASPSR